MAAVAGSNTLTGLIPVIYEAMDVIPRELVGAISAVTLDPSAEMAGLNQTIRSHVAPPAVAVDIAPGVTNANGAGQTINYADLLISKAKNAPILWSGEEQMLLKDQYAGIVADQFRQSFRTLGNLIENDIVANAAAGASRAVGTAGTTPFGTTNNMSDFGNCVKLLDDNGAPQMDRALILGTTAAQSIRANQSLLVKVNESGSSDLLRRGVIDTVFGLDIRTSGQIKAGAAVGTGAAYVLNGAHAVGQTTVTVKTGTGTILVGDVVTINGFNYIAQTSIAAPGSFTIAAPGLQVAGADSNPVTVNVASVKNVALQKAGFLLATRLPAMPQGGDAATDMTVVTDPVSGLSFQIALYRQYRQITIDVAIAWGTKVLRPEYCGVLMG